MEIQFTERPVRILKKNVCLPLGPVMDFNVLVNTNFRAGVVVIWDTVLMSL